MLLRELFEGGGKHVTFCFGRFNPPTLGHDQVFKTMKSQGGEMRIFTSMSQDKKKNPLDYPTKVNFLRKLFPQYAESIVQDTSLNTIVKVATYLYERGYRDATFVAGSDRIDDMSKLLKDYNGVEGKSHGYYKFDVLDFKSSGEREDGAEGVAGISGTLAREDAANNDLKKFAEHTGAGELAKPLFDAVRKGLGISDSVEENTMRAKEFEVKPRNFVAKNAKMGGAGAHRDKKKAEKQGDLKHKAKQIPMEGISLDEAYINTSNDAVEVLANLRKIGKSIERGQGSYKGNLANEYANDVWDVYSFIEARTKGFRDVDKNAMAAIDAMMDLRKEAKGMEMTPGSGSNARFGNQIATVLYSVMEYLYKTKFDRTKEESIAEGPNDGKEDNFTIDDIKKLERIRDLETLKAQAKELVKGKPARRMKAEKIRWFYNHIDTLKNPSAFIRMMYDLMLAGEGHKVIGSRNSTSSNSYRTRFGEQGVAERVRDPEDWDEGNTEPGNNFAVYINGKKWKVLPGPAGAYADSPEERREFARLQAMAQRKSQESGKKWEVHITGEPATK
jgi:hypothetical protein